MSIFLDTGLFLAYENPRDANHRAAVGIVEGAADGTWGEVFTSDYVFDRPRTQLHRLYNARAHGKSARRRGREL